MQGWSECQGPGRLRWHSEARKEIHFSVLLALNFRKE
jgi:hypothetical protein